MICYSMCEDPLFRADCFPPYTADLAIYSNKKKLSAEIYIASGSDPHPIMIIPKGFPGAVESLDLPHMFRCNNWSSLIFDYRGTGESEGSFSFQNAIDDVKAVLEFVRSDNAIKKYNIDRNGIILLGHGMGGFAALMAAVEMPGVKACAAIAPFDMGIIGGRAMVDIEALKPMKKMFEELVCTMKGATADDLMIEVMSNSDKWRFADNARSLANQNLMIVAGSRDIFAIPELHYQPLVNKMLSYKPRSFRHHLLDSDHSFRDQKLLLSHIMDEWLEEQLH
ncbi:MAG: alpha/beta hydrolase [Pseudomonadota bacterium]